ncbi:hypothetical protein ACFVGN_27275 [Streptomyces sp. NPDC057757]|uniref:hypothetical protein n=1 Tax=Streptomyces sp. NPDC057757 TaxID=3346241 RepID=UPI0036967D55
MTTTATHLRTTALHWTDLTDALDTTGTTTWPPAGRMTDYLTALDQADAETERQRALALRTLERDPSQIGETRAPLRIAILDTMRTVQAALVDTADQVAAVVQRSPMAGAPRGWPAADRARRDQLARADALDLRRWRYTGRRTAPYAALWLLARVQRAPGPFGVLPDREAALIANVAEGACERVERALDIAARVATLTRSCPDCAGPIEVHGGAGASPVAHCTACGRTWSEGGVVAA